MRLVDTVPVLQKGRYVLKGTKDSYEARMGADAWSALKRTEYRTLGELDPLQRSLCDPLLRKGRMDNGLAEMRLRGTEGLELVTVEVTDACNLRCKHCYLGEKANFFLPMDAYKRVVDDALELGAVGISITGGEAIIDKQLFDRIAYARDRDFKTTLVTNGTLLKTEHAERFAKLGMECIGVTLNGFKEQHEAIYGANTFEPALNAVKTLIGAGNRVYVNYNIYDGNVEIGEFEKFCKEIGVAGINASHIKPVGWGANMKDQIVQETPRCCGRGGNEQIMVKADGRVVPCAFIAEDVMGNVHAERLTKIYRRSRSEW